MNLPLAKRVFSQIGLLTTGKMDECCNMEIPFNSLPGQLPIWASTIGEGPSLLGLRSYLQRKATDEINMSPIIPPQGEDIRRILIVRCL
jgi:hypothetical protein